MHSRVEQVAGNDLDAGQLIGVRVELPSGTRVDGHQHGFSLVELITIMVIVGILAVAALPRFFDKDVFQARGAADQVKAALRYGQKVAIAQHRTSLNPVNVNITTAGSSDCSAVLVGGNVNCVILDSVLGAGFTKTVTFNALGQPVPNAADSITVGSTTITIEAETGYVH